MLKFSVLPLAALSLVLAVCIGASSSAPTEEFTVSSYDFTWTVAHVGDNRLRISKDRDRTVVQLNDDYGRVTLTGAEAEAVGVALANAEAAVARLRGGKDAEEELKVGGCLVTFSYSQKYGYTVRVKSAERFSSGVRLSLDAAREFAPHLQKASRMVAFINRKISF